MKKYISYLMSVLLLGGCLNIKLEDQYADPDAITTTSTARELLASAYNSLPRYQMELSILSDDFVPTNHAGKYVEMLNLYNWQEKAIDDLSDNIWNEYYMTVAIVNALLPRMENIRPKDEADELELENIRSEAKALKAMCYFDLLRLYGPVYDEANLSKDGIILKHRLELDFLQRSSLMDCVEEIEKLLADALKADNSDVEVFYLSTPAVQALLAEFELYRHNYKDAVSYGLPLLSGAENRWTKTEYDNLWADNTSADRIFAPYIFDSFYQDLCYDKTSGDYFVLDPAMSYGDADVRKDWASYSISMNGSQVVTLGKYNRMYYDNITVRYINTLRYSGVCFTVAEAYARDGDDDLARQTLNRLLNAYGAEPLDESLEGDALIEAILAEKQKEFAGEGVRFFDLKRHGRQLSKKGNFGTGTSVTIQPGDYRWLFPIPQSEYRYNDKITQNNPGWPFIKTE
jgi:hypothetical protein